MRVRAIDSGRWDSPDREKAAIIGSTRPLAFHVTGMKLAKGGRSLGNETPPTSSLQAATRRPPSHRDPVPVLSQRAPAPPSVATKLPRRNRERLTATRGLLATASVLRLTGNDIGCHCRGRTRRVAASPRQFRAPLPSVGNVCPDASPAYQWLSYRPGVGAPLGPSPSRRTH